PRAPADDRGDDHHRRRGHGSRRDRPRHAWPDRTEVAPPGERVARCGPARARAGDDRALARDRERTRREAQLAAPSRAAARDRSPARTQGVNNWPMSFGTLALVGLCGLCGPLLSAPSRGAIPVVVGEIAAGVVIGTTGLRAIDTGNATLSFL